ncbi:MAG: RidA family protein [Proteobacteria bacterium]|jgi:reactive intermediate/imine deaminase|nr:RidA family protein [Pseudomonadota bacterium]
MSKTIIHTENAPAAIGTYSQAVRVNSTIYLSGQIPLDPATMKMQDDNFSTQAHQVFKNLSAVSVAAGGSLQDMVKLNIFMVDLANFAEVNEIMSEYFEQPYPARAAVQVVALPMGAAVEMDGVLEMPDNYSY